MRLKWNWHDFTFTEWTHQSQDAFKVKGTQLYLHSMNTPESTCIQSEIYTTLPSQNEHTRVKMRSKWNWHDFTFTAWTLQSRCVQSKRGHNFTFTTWTHQSRYIQSKRDTTLPSRHEHTIVKMRSKWNWHNFTFTAWTHHSQDAFKVKLTRLNLHGMNTPDRVKMRSLRNDTFPLQHAKTLVNMNIPFSARTGGSQYTTNFALTVDDKTYTRFVIYI